LLGRPFTIQTDHKSLEWLDWIKDGASSFSTTSTRNIDQVMEMEIQIVYPVGHSAANYCTGDRRSEGIFVVVDFVVLVSIHAKFRLIPAYIVRKRKKTVFFFAILTVSATQNGCLHHMHLIS